MKLISEHLGEIIAALAGIVVITAAVLLFRAPISDYFTSIAEKLLITEDTGDTEDTGGDFVGENVTVTIGEVEHVRFYYTIEGEDFDQMKVWLVDRLDLNQEYKDGDDSSKPVGENIHRFEAGTIAQGDQVSVELYKDGKLVAKDTATYNPIDDTAPEIFITTPSEGLGTSAEKPITAAGPNVPFAGYATDQGGIANVTVNGEKIEWEDPYGLGTYAEWDITVTLPECTTSSITVVVTDFAGNSTTETRYYNTHNYVLDSLKWTIHEYDYIEKSFACDCGGEPHTSTNNTAERTWVCDCGNSYKETKPAILVSENGATCTEYGYHNYAAYWSQDDDNYDVDLKSIAYEKPLGHSLTTSTQQSDHNFDGIVDTVTYEHCTNYGCTYKNIISVIYGTGGSDDTCDHEYTTTTVEPTCTVGGHTKHECSCGDFYTSDFVPPLDHDWGEWVGDPSTDTKTRTCNRCGETETVAIDHTHKYNATGTKAPTCTEKGYTTYTCSCGASYTGNEVAALGHAWGEGVVKKEPTCSQKGEQKFTCSRCNETKIEEIDTTEHSWTACGTLATWSTPYSGPCTGVDTKHEWGTSAYWVACANCGVNHDSLKWCPIHSAYKP